MIAITQYVRHHEGDCLPISHIYNKRAVSIISILMLAMLVFRTQLMAQALFSEALPTTIQGTVFRDFDMNGAADSLLYGVEGIVVIAYDCDGNAIAQATSDSLGNYLLNGLTDGTRYRIEFSQIPAYLQASVYGLHSRSTVQFVVSPAIANLALANPEDYCQLNPTVATACYVNGDATGNGTTAADPVIVTFNYNDIGNSGDNPPAPLPTKISSASAVGSIWGLAYNRSQQLLFQATVTRRYMTYGPGGAGAIYVTDLSTSTPSTSIIDFTALVGTTDPIGVPQHATDAPANKDQPFLDLDVFDAVGKSAFGGIDVSPDDKILFITALGNRTIYAMPAVSNPTSFTPYSIPTSIENECFNGTYRPWGLKYWRGQVYVGIVCDASATAPFTSTTETGIAPVTTDLKAMVYAFDPAQINPVFNKVLAFDLDFQRGRAFKQGNVINSANWRPWINSPESVSAIAPNPVVSQYISYPQPILSDIEFDVDGSMILGFADRSGLQMSYQHYYFPEDTATKSLRDGFSPGDILRASIAEGSLATPTAWTIENNGSSGGVTTAGVNNSEGPGSGEFYFQDVTVDHDQAALGSLLLLPGQNEVATIAQDPNRCCWASGVVYFSNSTGELNRAYEVYQTPINTVGGFGKTIGLGDIELLCKPTPIEIGNYVWHDTNGNGIQDPCEVPIEGVTVVLLANDGIALDTAVTNENGEYYFSSAQNTNQLFARYNLPLTPNTSYTMSITPGQPALAGLRATLQHTTSDELDSDLLDDGLIAITTGNYGSVIHSLDAGFVTSCSNSTLDANTDPDTFSLIINTPTCSGSISNSDGYLAISNYEPTARYAVSVGASYTGAASFEAALPLPDAVEGRSKIVENISNIGTEQSFILRLYSSSGCYVEKAILLSAVDCTCLSEGVCIPTVIKKRKSESSAGH